MAAAAAALLLLLALSPVALAVDEIAQIAPTLLPTDASLARTLQVRFSPPGTGINQYSLTYEDPSAATHTLLANLSSADGLYRVIIPPSATAGFATLASGTRKVGLQFYDRPAFRPINAPLVTSAGLSSVSIESLNVLPTLSALVRVSCASIETDRDGLALLAADGSLVQSENLRGRTFDYLSSGAISSNGLNVTFELQPVPRTCGNASVEVSFNNGFNFHLAGFLNVTSFEPIPVVSLYPYKLADSPWVRAHQEARIAAASAFTAALKADVYYEESWRNPPLPTGRLVDADFFELGVKNKSAKIFLLAGTQYQNSTLFFSTKYPNVNFLLMSTLSANVPARPNVAFATGRMYEAAWIAGIIAGSQTKVGSIGMLLALNNTASFTILNAFQLGALQAINNGLNPHGVTASQLVTRSWLIGAFSDVWAEKNAALDLLAPSASGDPAVDILLPLTDNEDPQLECHNRGCLSIGFNGDERKSLGDSVLISLVYQLVPLYQLFLRKVVEGKPFGPANVMEGLGVGVEITTMSPAVSVATQREVTETAAIMRSLPQTQEKVFCTSGQIRAADGTTVLFDGTTPSNGLYASAGVVMGGLDGTTPCLPRSIIESRPFQVKGTRLHGLYVPPKKPTAQPIVPEVYQPDGGVYALCCIIGGLLILAALGAVIGVWRWKKSTSIAFASPFFLTIMLAGAVVYGSILFSDPFAAVPALTDAACTIQLWFNGIAFCLVFGALFAKTWRISIIFRSLKRVKVTLRHTLNVLAVIMFLELCVLGLITGVFPVGAVTLSLPPGGAYPTGLVFQRCGASPSNPISGTQGVDGTIILDILHVLILIWGGYLAWQVRSVPSGFNESRWIALAIAIELVFGIFALALSAAENASPAVSFVTDAIRFGVAPLLSLSLFFSSKFYSAYRNWADLTTERDSSGGFFLSPSTFGLRLVGGFNKAGEASSTDDGSGNSKVGIGTGTGGAGGEGGEGAGGGGSLLTLVPALSSATSIESGVAWGKQATGPSSFKATSASAMVAGGSNGSRVGTSSTGNSSTGNSSSSSSNAPGAINISTGSASRDGSALFGSIDVNSLAVTRLVSHPSSTQSPTLVGGDGQEGGACLPPISSGNVSRSASVAPAPSS